MRDHPPERDWKHFKKLRDLAIHRFFERVLEDVEGTVSDASITPHNRYLKVRRKVRACDKEMEAFEVLSRSRMMMQLAAFRSSNLIDDSEMQDFTSETREHLEALTSL